MGIMTAINDVPGVKAKARAMLEARQKRDEADGKIRELQAALVRDVAEADPLDAAMARIDLPELQRAFLVADREVLKAEAAWRGEVAKAKEALERARVAGRQEIMRRADAKLAAASVEIEALRRYDAETVDLGGRQPEPFWAELLPGDAGLLEFRRRRAEADGWL
jgi:hypothetical protein